MRCIAAMEATARVRRPNSIHTTDQIVAPGARLSSKAGISNDDLVGARRGAVIGLHPRDEQWYLARTSMRHSLRRPRRPRGELRRWRKIVVRNFAV
jgi:hypothetical protein